ncbi:septal ring lytic transglycosylase RlpA family protein [Rheinheimera tilapiae]|jgi:rare lipoprotein A|uniref:Endolytic peptidoglycan transglycosylase RlpA n=1 Tax=Rheinheimera tilapiae TaxID=875043 RepID=A0ABV6BCF3_9GAMM
MKHSFAFISLPGSGKKFSVIAFAVLLSACSSAPEQSDSGLRDNMDPNAGRYSQDKDSIPLRLPTEDELRDPEPTVEGLSRGGNKPYNIYGVNYSPRTDILQYEEEGVASWYGSKFHGHLTSNGEVYNVFSMTAAHKTLPLPSYVRVTNLDNYRTAIVRVNDRGPFHDNRIIDLSYSAAYKLGIFPGGTGRVKLELISSPAMASQESFATPIAKLPDIPYQPVTPSERPSRSSNEFVERPYVPAGTVAQPQAVAPVSTTPKAQAPVRSNPSAGSSANGCYIQLIASSDKAKVQRLGNELQQQLSVPTAIESVNGLFRLLAGPLQDNAQHMLDTLRSGEYPQAYFTNKSLCS